MADERGQVKAKEGAKDVDERLLPGDPVKVRDVGLRLLDVVNAAVDSDRLRTGEALAATWLLFNTIALSARERDGSSEPPDEYVEGMLDLTDEFCQGHAADWKKLVGVEPIEVE